MGFLQILTKEVDIMTINHGTDIYTAMLIWKSRYLTPQPYKGGDSILPAGEEVIFCFPAGRRLTLAEVFFEIPDYIPREKGRYRIWTDEYGDFLPFPKWETEYYVRIQVPIDICEIYRLDDVPNLDDFQWDCPDYITENPYSDEFKAVAEDFLQWLSNIPKRKFLDY